MDKKHYCLVGFGNHSKSKIIPAIKKSNGIIDGIVSKRTKNYGSLIFFSSIDEAFTKVNSNTIFIICSPPDLHYSQAIDVVKRGHNVFIEKPVSINVVDLDDIINISYKKNVFFAENLMHEYSDYFQDFISFFNSNKNEIKKIDINFTLPSLPKGTFRDIEAMYPISLFDIGCYPISLINKLNSKTNYRITNILNRGNVFKEQYSIKTKILNANVTINFGINDFYKNFITITKTDDIEYKFEPFFFGREGNRTIQEIRGKNILTKEVYVKDCFQTLFEKNNQYWVDTQITRNRDMLNNLSSLENLSKQYNDI